VVPDGTIPLVIFTGVTVKPTSLQTDAVIGVIAGLGFTVTVTVKLVPVQLPAAGVIVYIAVCVEFVGLVNVPLMLAPIPDTPPVRPPVTIGASQLYDVPAGTTPFVVLSGEMLKAISLHTVEVIDVIDGLGFTVTIIVKSLPVQLPDAGATVYIAVWGELVGLVSVMLML
jgi:hypothetical protein